MAKPDRHAVGRVSWRALLVGVTGVVCGWYWLLAWKTGFVPGELPQVNLPPAKSAERVLVVAPHEDDEALGTGGYLVQARAAGAEVYVCLLTNGEGEELGAAWTNRTLHLTPARFMRLGQVRQQETLRALAEVGIDSDQVLFLGYPNLGLDSMLSAEHWDYQHPFASPYLRAVRSPYANSYTPAASFCGASLAADLRSVLQMVHPTRVFTCHPADVHRDHWPAYTFVQLALDAIAREPHGTWAAEVPVYCYLVHRPGFPQPFGMSPGSALAAPPALEDLPLNAWIAFPLPPSAREAKRLMLSTYRSQGTAFDLLIHSFVRVNELFATVRLLELSPGLQEGEPRPTEREPVGDLTYLRRQPGTDIAAVEAAADGASVDTRVKLAGLPARNVKVRVLVSAPVTSGRHLQALQMDCVRGQPAVLIGATSHWRVSADDLRGVEGLQSGDTVRLTFPRRLLGSCDRFALTAVTYVGSRARDHSMTRTYTLRLRR